ncbi:MAG: NAD(P)/FAD-dependent oxidoreductase [Acidiferrobacterales bacterium]|nr:NAD(P)/FAD-dependent oxidoreductase [Acidiferrobacterales bacterium]
MGNSNVRKTFIDRREFLTASCLAVVTAATTKLGFIAKSAQADSLWKFIAKSEADLFYRNRLPDDQTPLVNDPVAKAVNLFDWNFPELVENATGGTFGSKGMPENFSETIEVPEAYLGMPVAIVGAGASGLSAGFELMKLGLKPVYYEVQTQSDSSGKMHARPYGRIFSWDFGGNGELSPGGAGWYPDGKLTTSSVMPNSQNTHNWGRRVAELGGMRFPATQLTLRTYTDSIFQNGYYYGDSFDSPWVPFRDPGLYSAKNNPDPSKGGVVMPSDNDTIEFDTVYNTKGIFKDRGSAEPTNPEDYSDTDRVAVGTTLADSNQAVYNLTFKYFDLLYGDVDPSNPYKGILTPIKEQMRLTLQTFCHSIYFQSIKRGHFNVPPVRIRNNRTKKNFLSGFEPPTTIRPLSGASISSCSFRDNNTATGVLRAF